MKKITFFLLGLSLILTSCGGGDDAGSSCSKVDSFTISQQIDKLHYAIIASGDASFYEISIGNPGAIGDPSGGNIHPVQTATGDIDISDYGYMGATVAIYARTVCPDGSKGKWSTAVSLPIAEFCKKPRDVVYDGLYLSWDDVNWDVNVSQYQVKFGLEGFNVNTGGTLKNTNVPSLDGIPMQAQTTYDFYVRSNCGGSGGWSSWSGPYTYYSEYTQNMCAAPVNLSYVTLYNNGTPWGAEFHYNGNGELSFEYALKTGALEPAGGEIHSIGAGSTPVFTNMNPAVVYKFYVRGVCANGNKTAWSVLTVDL
jgi:hypothetical protein